MPFLKAKKLSSHHVYQGLIHDLKLVILCRSPGPSGGQSKRPMDKKLRRQIANCNERRRMQSINAGFHTLRVLMPHLQGEKLSKVCGFRYTSMCYSVLSHFSCYTSFLSTGSSAATCGRAHLQAQPRTGTIGTAEHVPTSDALQILA